MSLRTLLLWRHGETDFNAEGRMQGHLDSSLTELGRRQVRAATPLLAAWQPELVVSSDLRRAADTASVFVAATGVELRVDKRLRETNLGGWQGKTAAEIDIEWPDARERWYADPRWAPPGGETKLDVAQRAMELVAELDTEVDGTVLFAAHGGLITALVGALLRLPPDCWPQLGGIDNCGWTVLGRRGGQWRLHRYNVGIPR